MQAVNMLESMFEWLLQPAGSGKAMLPVYPTASAADGQPAPAAEVSTQPQGSDRSGHPLSTLQSVV